MKFIQMNIFMVNTLQRKPPLSLYASVHCKVTNDMEDTSLVLLELLSFIIRK